MSAFENLIDLRFAVSDHVGNRSISDVFPRLVEMAENDLNSRLRTRWQLQDYTLYFEDEVSTLPPDFLEMYSVAGRERGDYEIGPMTIRVARAGGDRACQYYAKLPTLSCSPTACNWLLSRYPDVYLYGVALQAAKYLRDMDLAAVTASLYGDALKLLQIDDDRARWSVARVRVRGLTP